MSPDALARIASAAGGRARSRAPRPMAPTMDGGPATAGEDDGLDELLAQIRHDGWGDFTGYERASLKRGLQRRMRVIGAVSFRAYRALLVDEPLELPRLFDTLLVNVTSFFRDPEAWSALEARLSGIFGAGDDAPVRIWSAGCSTGEEPYTLAMLLCSVLGPERFSRRVKIYATDTDEAALEVGRLASYPARALESVPPVLLARHFVRDGASFVVEAALRQAVLFRRHDLGRDAPIARVTTLACRNALIYFDVETQSRILARLLFALNPSGLLMLGKSELLAAHADLFTPVDLEQRLFARAPKAMRARERHPGDAGARPPAGRGRSGRRETFEPGPCAEVAVRDEHLAVANEPARAGSAPVARAGDDLAGAAPGFAATPQARRLHRELRRKNEALATAHATLQATSAALVTANEELRFTVDELETTQDELEATNEELEATNEELHTINEELRVRAAELHSVNGFHAAILDGLRLGVAVLSRDLVVQVWSSSLVALWRAPAAETLGKPFLDLDLGLPIAELAGSLGACAGAGDGAERTLSRETWGRRRSAWKVAIVPLRGDGNEGVMIIVEEIS